MFIKLLPWCQLSLNFGQRFHQHQETASRTFEITFSSAPGIVSKWQWSDSVPIKWKTVTQGRMGKVACKASTEIGHCAWRMIGRQSTNNSKSVIILFLELMVWMIITWCWFWCVEGGHVYICADDSLAMMLENRMIDRYEGEDMMVVASFKGGKRNMWAIIIIIMIIIAIVNLQPHFSIIINH